MDGKPNRSVIRNIFFVLFHLGLIAALWCFGYQYVWIIDTGYRDVLGWHWKLENLTANLGFQIVGAIFIHFFGSLLYEEYTRKD